MLRTRLIQPEILRALAGAGHGSRVLIADGNYPAATHRAPNATVVYLNLSPGVVTVPEVLQALVATVPIEEAHVMQPADGSTPAIFEEFTRFLPEEVRLQPLERFAFYEAASQPAVCLVIATGEQRVYANLLLTLGVVPPPTV